MPGGGGLVPVSIKDLSFDPPNVMINKGDTVIWTNTVAVPHVRRPSESVAQK
jgi:plastocyanin